MNLKEREAAKKTEKDAVDAAVAKYLEKGGEVTVCETNARTPDLPVGQWGRRKKKKS